MPLKRVAILGSTGSIGLSTLDVIARHPQRYAVQTLTAFGQIERLFDQCRQFEPAEVVVVDAEKAQRLQAQLRAAGMDHIKVYSGSAALEQVVQHDGVDVVMAAIVGAAGLMPTLAAVRAGKQVLFANKEPLVMCGHIFLEEAARSGAQLLPIDSEHNAIFQCMPAGYCTGDKPAGVRRILLTGSGGPFRDRDPGSLKDVTPEQAIAHPNWSMGPKISVDSATMMNKGLELIEACWLFNTGPDDIQIVVHPQSVIHSMVEYDDGSVLAQMGNPDMRTPIAHALAWPDRVDSGVASLNLFDVQRLEFEPPDENRFPCLRLAREAILAGGTAPAILNAANEVAVEAFLDGRIGFMEIPQLIDNALAAVAGSANMDLESIRQADRLTREYLQLHVGSSRAPAQGVRTQ